MTGQTQLSGWLGDDTWFELRSDGYFGPKEIGRLIRKLSLEQKIAEEDAAEDAGQPALKEPLKNKVVDKEKGSQPALARRQHD